MLLCYFTSSGASLTSPVLTAVSERATTHTESVFLDGRQLQPHFTRWCTSSTHGGLLPHVLTSCRRCCWPTLTRTPTTSLESCRVSCTRQEKVGPPWTGHAAASQTGCISLSVWRRPAAFCIITRLSESPWVMLTSTFRNTDASETDSESAVGRSPILSRTGETLPRD